MKTFVYIMSSDTCKSLYFIYFYAGFYSEKRSFYKSGAKLIISCLVTSDFLSHIYANFYSFMR